MKWFVLNNWVPRVKLHYIMMKFNEPINLRKWSIWNNNWSSYITKQNIVFIHFYNNKMWTFRFSFITFGEWIHFILVFCHFKNKRAFVVKRNALLYQYLKPWDEFHDLSRINILNSAYLDQPSENPNYPEIIIYFVC